MKRFNQFLDQLSDFFANRKGLLLFLGFILVVANLILQIFPGVGWLANSNLLLHLGVLTVILGILLAWAL
ncbi:MAG TPA: hypothetical protein EYP88_08540 [Anaerolineales bacterium]|nr:hypothetical protein [Anaerolineales bacterium]